VDVNKLNCPTPAE